MPEEDEPLSRLLKAARHEELGGDRRDGGGAGPPDALVEREGIVRASESGEEEVNCGSASGAASAAAAAAIPSSSSAATEGGIAKPNRRWNRHTVYRDHSRSPPTPSETEQLESAWECASTTPAMRAVLSSSSRVSSIAPHGSSGAAAPAHKEPTFPLKLHMILSRPEWHDVACWLPHGRSFRILNPGAFEELVLPLYYHHAKYASFARQLNGWNFKRVSSGKDFNSYYHELFLRGLPHLCLRMRRLTARDIAELKQELASSARQNGGPRPVSASASASESSVEPKNGKRMGARGGGGGSNAAPDFYAISRDHPVPVTDEAAPLPAPLASILLQQGEVERGGNNGTVNISTSRGVPGDALSFGPSLMAGKTAASAASSLLPAVPPVLHASHNASNSALATVAAAMAALPLPIRSMLAHPSPPASAPPGNDGTEAALKALLLLLSGGGRFGPASGENPLSLPLHALDPPSVAALLSKALSATPPAAGATPSDPAGASAVLAAALARHCQQELQQQQQQQLVAQAAALLLAQEMQSNGTAITAPAPPPSHHPLQLPQHLEQLAMATRHRQDESQSEQQRIQSILQLLGSLPPSVDTNLATRLQQQLP